PLHSVGAAAPGVGFNNVLMFDSEDQAPGDDTSIVSSMLTGINFGPVTTVTTEANSHVIEPFMDSLAVHTLMGSMNRSMTVADTGKLLEAISNLAENTDE